MSPASVVVRLVAVIAFGYWPVTYGADAVGALSQLVGGGSQRPNPTFGVLCMLGGLASAFEFPGRNMHAWVSFVGTAKVAAVSLQRDVPVSGTPPPSAPPWHATLEALAVPPTTFVMP